MRKYDWDIIKAGKILSKKARRAWRHAPKLKKKKNRKKKRKLTYFEYINSSIWGKRRYLYFQTHERKCRGCNKTGFVHLHHLLYENFGHEKDRDLIPLCKKCHKEFHRKFEMRKDLRIPTDIFIAEKQKSLAVNLDDISSSRMLEKANDRQIES